MELLDLPTEILLHIIHQLCPHCIIESQNLGICVCQYPENPLTPPPNPLIRPKPLNTPEQLRQSLAHLSRTSRTLRDLAQPVLYHSPAVRKAHRLRLASTLVRRQDLALCVRELHLGRTNDGETILPPRDPHGHQALFNDILARFPADLNTGWPVSLTDNWLADIQVEPQPGIRPGLVIDALLLTLTPNVEHVHVLAVPHPPNRFPYCMPGSLPRLTDLTLADPWDEWSGVSIDCVWSIFRAAPALVRFKGIRIRGISAGVGHPGLRSVDLESSALSARDLENLMRGFPKLEAFGYDNDGQDVSPTNNAREAMPNEIGAALLLRKDTLRDVDIDFARSRLYDHARLTRIDAMGRLAEMRVLETLALDRDAVYISKEMRPDTDWSDDEDDNGEDYPGYSEEEDGVVLGGRKKEDFFDKFLPPSIRYFKFFDRNGLLFPDLLRLAEVKPQRFPNLEKVRLWGIGEDERKALKRAFKAVGVKFYYGGNL